MLARIKGKLAKSNVSFFVFFLVCVFGTGSWIAVNGLWVELPVLVRKAPESWTLPSYLTVIIQLGNIGPIIYAFGKKFKPRFFVESWYIHGALITGALSCFLLGFLWDSFSTINGKQHSVALFILTFFFATADCSSSVTFLPFVGGFKKEYMTAYFAGQGFSSLIPSLFALVQGIGESETVHCRGAANKGAFVGNRTSNETKGTYAALEEPRFGAGGFFFILFTLMVLSEFAFLALLLLPSAKNERAQRRPSTPASKQIEDGQRIDKTFDDDKQLEGSPLGGKNGSINQEPHELELPTADKDSKSSLVADNVYEDCVEDTNQYPVLSMRWILVMLILQAVLSGLSNGVLPAIQSFATLPYGGKEYHLSLTLGAIVNPLACFAYDWLTLYTAKWIIVWSAAYLGLAMYVVGIAVESPCPPMQDSGFGSFLIVFIIILGTALVSYLKLAIATLLRNQGQKALLWCGISIQLGSCIGAIIMFPLVSVYSVFKQHL